MLPQEPKEGEEEEACLDLLPSLVKVEDGAPEPVPEEAQEAQEHGEQQQEGAKPEALLPGLDEPVPDDWETIEGGCWAQRLFWGMDVKFENAWKLKLLIYIDIY